MPAVRNSRCPHARALLAWCHDSCTYRPGHRGQPGHRIRARGGARRAMGPDDLVLLTGRNAARVADAAARVAMAPGTTSRVRDGCSTSATPPRWPSWRPISDNATAGWTSCCPTRAPESRQTGRNPSRPTSSSRWPTAARRRCCARSARCCAPAAAWSWWPAPSARSATWTRGCTRCSRTRPGRGGRGGRVMARGRACRNGSGSRLAGVDQRAVEGRTGRRGAGRREAAPRPGPARGTLVAAVCPGLVDTEASRPWFADFSQAQSPERARRPSSTWCSPTGSTRQPTASWCASAGCSPGRVELRASPRYLSDQVLLGHGFGHAFRMGAATVTVGSTSSAAAVA